MIVIKIIYWEHACVKGGVNIVVVKKINNQ